MTSEPQPGAQPWFPKLDRPTSPSEPAPDVSMTGATRDTRVESAAAILSDTARWRETRHILQKARRAVEGAGLSVADLSYFAVYSDAIEIYARHRDELLMLLVEGIGVMEDVEGRLVAVGRAIALTEEENRETMEKVAERLEAEGA